MSVEAIWNLVDEAVAVVGIRKVCSPQMNLKQDVCEWIVNVFEMTHNGTYLKALTSNALKSNSSSNSIGMR